MIKTSDSLINEWLVDIHGAITSFNENVKKGKIIIEQGSGLIKSVDNKDIIGCLVAGSKFAEEMLSLVSISPSANLPDKVKGSTSNTSIPNDLLNQILDISRISNLAPNSIALTMGIANLAISVAGFSLVMNKLSQIDDKLSSIIEQIIKLQNNNKKFEIHADLVALINQDKASKKLDQIIESESTEHIGLRSQEVLNLLHPSDTHYRAIWTRVDPWLNSNFSLDEAIELYLRIASCVFLHLKTSLISSTHSTDMSHFRQAEEQLGAISLERIGPSRVLRARSDAAIINGTKFSDSINQKSQFFGLWVAPWKKHIVSSEVRDLILLHGGLDLCFDKITQIRHVERKILNSIDVYKQLSFWAQRSSIPFGKIMKRLRELNPTGLYLLIPRELDRRQVQQMLR